MKKLVLVLFLSVLLAGCVPGLRSESKDPSSQPSDFVKGRAVKGFPNIPLFPEASLIETYGNGSSYGGNAYTLDTIENVVAFYEAGLPQLGWESTSAQDKNGSHVFTINNKTQRGWVIVNLASDAKTVAITFAVTAR